MVTEKRHLRRCATVRMRQYTDFPFIWSLVVTSLTNHALCMDLEECFSLRRVYNLRMTYSRRTQINIRIYSVFRHTQHNYGSKVASFGLFTGHHQTCTYNNIGGRLYNCPQNLEKEISSFALKYIQLVKLHSMGKNNVKL